MSDIPRNGDGPRGWIIGHRYIEGDDYMDFVVIGFDKEHDGRKVVDIVDMQSGDVFKRHYWYDHGSGVCGPFYDITDDPRRATTKPERATTKPEQRFTLPDGATSARISFGAYVHVSIGKSAFIEMDPATFNTERDIDFVAGKIAAARAYVRQVNAGG